VLGSLVFALLISYSYPSAEYVTDAFFIVLILAITKSFWPPYFDTGNQGKNKVKDNEKSMKGEIESLVYTVKNAATGSFFSRREIHTILNEAIRRKSSTFLTDHVAKENVKVTTSENKKIENALENFEVRSKWKSIFRFRKDNRNYIRNLARVLDELDS
jgi:hypothetical protein